MKKSDSQPRELSDNNRARNRIEEACDLNLLARALDCLSEMVLITDAARRIIYANPAVENILGYTPDEIIGRQSSEIFGDIPGNPDDLIGEIKKEGKDGVWKKEIYNRRRDGSLIRVSLTLNQLSDREGNLLGTIGITRDITERKEAEEALRRSKEETDRANRELEEAIKRANRLALEAEMANRAKSQFLANMSHEIRTPMNGVIGMTGLLLETDLSEEQRDYLEIIQTSGNALLQIINNILDLSKIEAGKLELDRADFELRKVIEEVIDIVTPRAHEKGLELTHLVEPDLPAVLRGDPVRLRQILLNLVNNAVKFTGKGEVSIQVRKAEEKDEKIVIRFTVTDSGIGIPAHRQKHLFESFVQGDSSSTRKYGGSGLGLAIARELAALMGGDIGLESGEGEGSSFWFTAVFKKIGERGIKPSPAPVKLRDKKILVVDDNAASRQTILSLLQDRGAVCREAKSGKQALDLLRAAAREKSPFDLIILDMGMPAMSGEELGRKIKSDGSLKEIKMIAMLTSSAWTGMKDVLHEIGFAATITKPVKKSRLYNCLAEALGEQAELSKTEKAPAHRRDLRVLVAEDNPVNQKVSRHILEKLGYQADVVADGKAALTALEKNNYDLILMDIQMPELDGLETTRIIREREANHAHRSEAEIPISDRDSPLPIIAMTAHALEGDREKFLEAGMDGYISKPVKPVHIENAIAKLFAGAKPEPGNGRVLVVDDEERICSFCRRELEEAGYLVREARDGRAALEINRKTAADLVLLDLAMDGMDGSETLRELRKEWPDLPVIIITAYGDSELMLRALEYSPFMVLNKPFTREQLLSVVKDTINANQRSDRPLRGKKR